ncbi:unnamed protein product, partial [Ixodes hexagonus]
MLLSSKVIERLLEQRCQGCPGSPFLPRSWGLLAASTCPCLQTFPRSWALSSSTGLPLFLQPSSSPPIGWYTLPRLSMHKGWSRWHSRSPVCIRRASWSAPRAPRAFVYPTDALAYCYLPVVSTNDGARFSASSSRVLCASFMLPAHWRSLFFIYFFPMVSNNVRMRGRQVLVRVLRASLHRVNFSLILSIRRFPWPSLPEQVPEVDSHSSLGAALMVFGFAGPFLLRVSSAVYENSAGMKVYGNSKGLDGIDLEIYEGQLTVLLGQNGAGKSSLINIVAGLTCSNGGRINVCGVDATSNMAEVVQQAMSFCPQKNCNFSDMTVREHLVYFGKLRRVSSSVLPQRVTDVMKSLKLTEKANILAQRLSDAMKRRLDVAIALMSKPRV